MEPGKSSLSFEIMPDWEKGLIYQRVMLLLGGIREAGEMGRGAPSGSAKGNADSCTWGRITSDTSTG